MTDQEIDLLLDQHRPHLREAYRNLFEKGQPWVALKVASMKLPNGADWDIVMLWLTEPVAALVHGTLTGSMAMQQSLQKAVAPAKQQQQAKPGTGAFGLPGM